jgi:hypothetical protein
MEGEDKSALKRLDRTIIEAIVAKTSLSADQIKTWDIEKIEKEIGIKAVTPKRYFAWEKGEKVGWQIFPYKFVSREVFDKRESRLDKLMDEDR